MRPSPILLFSLLLCGACSTAPETPAVDETAATTIHPLNQPLPSPTIDEVPYSEPETAPPPVRAPVLTTSERRAGERQFQAGKAFADVAEFDGRVLPAEPQFPWPQAGSWNREGYDAIQENRFLSVALSPLSTFGLDVDTASYANLRRLLNQNRRPPADAVRIEELVNYFDYQLAGAAGDGVLSVSSDYAVAPWNPAHRLCLIGVRAGSPAALVERPNRLVFLVDSSGSMNAPDKLPLLVRAFGRLVDGLGPDDRVAIVSYAGSAGLVLPSTAGDQRAQILGALGRLSAGGSTAGGQGIALAYAVARQQFAADANNRVVLATDGDFNVGASSAGELVRMIEARRDQGIYLTVLGFGSGNYQDGRMQQLASHGNGTHHYIDSDAEAARVLGERLVSTLYTVAKDVKLQVEWNPAVVSQYRLIGYENRVMAAEDFRDDAKDSGDVGAGQTVVALYEIVPRGAAAPPDVPRRYGPAPDTRGSAAMELGQVRIRYQAPDGGARAELTHLMQTRARPLAAASADLRWASAVAEMGLLLRQSPHRGGASYAALLARARGSLADYGADPARSEFLALAQRAAQSAGHDGAGG